ncbi:hypothetical protein TNCV_2650211 [Trichonephila clavipes]|nr:hypothetical protein TNCV_2650211 [Trichonephila clavipes]
MSSPGFEPSPYGTDVSVANHYTGGTSDAGQTWTLVTTAYKNFSSSFQTGIFHVKNVKSSVVLALINSGHDKTYSLENKKGDPSSQGNGLVAYPEFELVPLKTPPYRWDRCTLNLPRLKCCPWCGEGVLAQVSSSSFLAQSPRAVVVDIHSLTRDFSFKIHYLSSIV